MHNYQAKSPQPRILSPSKIQLEMPKSCRLSSKKENKISLSSINIQLITFNTGMEDPEAKPIKVVIYRCKIIDVKIQHHATAPSITLLLLLLRAWARTWTQRKQPHCLQSTILQFTVQIFSITNSPSSKAIQ
jgi:hypothetical protein